MEVFPEFSQKFHTVGHDLIGVARATIRELSFTPTELPIMNPEKKSRIGYRSSGAFMVTAYQKLKEDQVTKYSPAYKIFPYSNKLDRKDFLGKSGQENSRNFLNTL
jgi:hypothetical protein